MKKQWCALSMLLAACGGASPSEPASDAASTDAGPVGGGDAASSGADIGPVDPGPLPSLRVVPGDLTMTTWTRPGDATSAHVYSLLADGTLRQRLTAEEGAWGVHVVGPDKRHVALVRRTNDTGQDDAAGRGVVWIVDVRTRDAWPLTPPECDAGLGGLGWRDEVQVVFSMTCGDTAQLYLASIAVRSRARGDLLQLTDSAGGTRDVFTATRTSIATFVRPCEGAGCGGGAQVWLADLDSGDACAVTPPGAENAAHPALNGDLSAVTYALNGQTHRIGLNVAALYAGEPRCGLTETDTVLSEDLWTQSPGSDEDFPQMATSGGLLAGAVLFVARDTEGRGQVTLSDRMGTLTTLSDRAENATYARWVVDAFDTSGVR